MLFHSLAYLYLFLPVTLGGFFVLGIGNRQKQQILWLIAASLFFYAWWNPAYLALLLFSIGFNFGAFRMMQRGWKRKKVLTLAITINLALLAYFKYANFFVHTLNKALGTNWVLESIVLPLAISFFTFQQISFLVDAYRGEVDDVSFTEYCLYVSFFPQLIAGPIVRHHQMIPQFRSAVFGRINAHNVVMGMALIAMGLCKKIILADAMGNVVDPLYAEALAGNPLSFSAAWIAAIGFGLQIYFDFSGYTDMAIGSARLFSLRLPENFLSPYKSRSVQQFWQRWNVTLSSFLRDYLYIPLGGNRKGHVRTLLNLMVTMVLGGLWHGAGLLFLFWGGLHGLLLVLHYLWRKLKIQIPAPVAIFTTSACVMALWVFFRAEVFSASIPLYKGLLGMSSGSTVISLQHMIFVAASLFIVWFLPSSSWLVSRAENEMSMLQQKMFPPHFLRSLFFWGVGITMACLIAIVIFTVRLHGLKPVSFIYFQF